MTAAHRRQQAQRLVELFMRQRVANERNDRASADALFGQTWDVLARHYEPARRVAWDRFHAVQIQDFSTTRP